MGLISSSLRNVEVKEDKELRINQQITFKELSINQQITFVKNIIYEDRDTIYENIVKNEYIGCYCGCKYNQIVTKLKQAIVDDYTLLVEGNIDIIYNEILKTEDKYRKNSRENIKKCKNTYLKNLMNIYDKYDRYDSFIKNSIHLSIDNDNGNNKIDIHDLDYKNLIIIKDSGIKKLPIIINKRDEELLRSKGFIGNVLKECLTARKLVLEHSINKSHNKDIKDTKKRKRRIEQADILPMKKLNTTRYELDNYKYLINKYTYKYSSGCSCSCVNTITIEEAGGATLLVEGYRKKIIDTFIEDCLGMHHIAKKTEKPALLHIIYYGKDNENEENIDIYSGSYIIDYYTYIDDEIIPVIIDIKDESNLRKMGLIRNVIIDSTCSRLLLENV